MGDITIPAAFIEIVDKQGLMTLEMVNFINLVGDLAISEGSGSPEGVLEAKVSKLYLDTSGAAGTVQYIKRDSDIGGDASLGWVQTGDVGATTVELFQARKTTTQALTGSMADITGWAAADKSDSSFSFNTIAGVLTLGTNGWYDIALHTNYSGTGTRHGIAIQAIDSVLIPGTLAQGYFRLGAAETPSVSVPSCLYEVTAAPVDINIQASFNDTGSITLTDARLTVKKVGT